MKVRLTLATFGSLVAVTSAWTNLPSSTKSSPSSSTAASASRRVFLDTASKLVPLVFIALPTFAEDEAATAAIATAEVANPSTPPPPPTKNVVDYSVGVISLDDERDPPPLPRDPRDVVDYRVGGIDLGGQKSPPPEPVEEETPSQSEEPLDENEFIATLKARSIANKDKNKKLSERTDKLSVSAFRSQYNRPSFVGVRDPDQTDRITMVLKQDFDKMLQDGAVKQTYESKISKKTGELSDDYTRPIFVYVKEQTRESEN